MTLRFARDPTGFPLVLVPEIGLEAQLLPVTKLQLAPFAEGQGASWYDDLLDLNPSIEPEGLRGRFPRAALRDGHPPRRGPLVQPPGSGRASTSPPSTSGGGSTAPWPTSSPRPGKVTDLLAKLADAGVRDLIERHLGLFQPRWLLDLCMLRSGVVEWAKEGEAWVGLGAPRPQFHPNLWDPLANTVRPMSTDQRLKYFGFRLVRRV